MQQSIKNIYHLCIAVLAVIWYGFPGQKLTVIGVTGTDGKTTTTSLIYHILRDAGKKVSMVSTVSAVISGKVYDTGFHVTTPSPWAVQKFLRKAIDSGDEYMVLEVTSHALDQYRVWGISFLIGVLTNVTHEHLDYHKTYERYVKTKIKLLETSAVAVVNIEDQSYEIVRPQLENGKMVITYGLKSGDVNAINFLFKTKLIGNFNKYNCLAAVAVAKELKIAEKTIRGSLGTFLLPKGRMELVHDDGFQVVVDFAHTPNAISHVLQALRGETAGRIIHVFGSAGDRDTSKRPFMGAASAQYADVIILTAEDPRSERVENIIEDIEAGIKNLKEIEVLKIPNRENAIWKALSLAKKDDTVVITGKGHELSMNLGQGEVPWSDQEVVEKALKA